MFGSMMGNMPSVADIAAVTRNNGNGDGNYGFGEGWWVIVILLAIFGGFGGYGYGGGLGGNGATFQGAVTDASLQRGFDTQSILNSLRGIEQGICSLGYDQLAQFNNIGNLVQQSAFNISREIQNDTVSNMRNTWEISRQISDCCCENRSGQKDILFEMSKESCATNNNIHNTGDAIIRSNQDGFNMLERTINARFDRLELEQKNQYIAKLERELSDCNLDTKLEGVIRTLRPIAVPAYEAESPFASAFGSRCGGFGRRSSCCDGC